MIIEEMEPEITPICIYHRETEFFLENSVSGVLE